jgi:hypothetical protein
MAVDLICPECGGIIGASDIDDNGRSPCSCLDDEPAASPVVDKSDTVTMPSPEPAERKPARAVETDAPEKVCFACGKNVSGHRRTKDSRHVITNNVRDQEVDYKNRMIEIFGYPYAGDIGPGKAYRSGYVGPDLVHHLYVSTRTATGETAPPAASCAGSRAFSCRDL